ncbi:MAG: protein kinase [Elusimicrobia bacterium]|nr:protein kinase [Elusimicrobiota bacterium]
MIRVLIASHNPDLVELIRGLLVQERFLIKVVLDDGTEALERIRSNPPDLALLQQGLSRMSGCAVCDALRRDSVLKHLPVVIISGTPGNRAFALTAGADDFLLLPLDVVEFCTRTRAVLRRCGGDAVRAEARDWKLPPLATPKPSSNDQRKPESQTEVQFPSSLAESQTLSIPSEVVQHAGAPNIPGYVLTSPLGRGAYAQVWKAWQSRTRKWVAVKVFLERTGVNWILLQREVERLIRLDKHPHVVSLLDAELTGEIPFYVMDFLEKGSLERFVHPASAVAPELASRWMREMAEALSYVHCKGLVHCDLKPANVLLDEEGRIRVADFGQSRIVTESSGALGTLFYMAPEQAVILQDNEQAQPNVKWDVYALGATLYSILTGKIPYEHESKMALLKTSSLRERLKAYRELVFSKPLPECASATRGWVDEDLAAMLAKCVSADPERRYADMAEVLADLQARTDRKPVSPLAHKPGYRVKRFLQRNAVLVGVTCAALGGLIWAGTQIVRKKAQLAEQSLVTQDMSRDAKYRQAQSLLLRAKKSLGEGDEGVAALWYARSNLVSPSFSARTNALSILQSMPSLLKIIQSTEGLSPVISPDGKRALLGSRAGTLLVDLSEVKVLALLNRRYDDAAFSPDGATLFLSRSEQWKSLQEGRYGRKKLRHFLEFRDGMTGKLLSATALESQEADSDAPTNRPEFRFASNGRMGFFMKAGVGTLLEVKTGRFHGPRIPLDPVSNIHEVAISPDGSKVFGSAPDGTGRLWDSATGHLFGKPIERYSSLLRGALPRKEAESLIQGERRERCRIIRLRSDDARPISVPFGVPTFSPDGRWLHASDHGTSRIWNSRGMIPVGDPIFFVKGGDAVRTVAFSPRGNLLVAGLRDNTAQCVTIPPEAEALSARTILRHPGAGEITQVLFSDDGRALLTGSSGGLARVWDMKTWGFPPLSNWIRHSAGLMACAFGPGEGQISTVTSGSDAKTLWVWNTRGFAASERIAMQPPFAPPASVELLTVNAAGDRALVQGQDADGGTVLRLLDTQTSRFIGPPVSVRGMVQRPQFSKDGTLLLVTVAEQFLRWNATTGEPLPAMQSDGESWAHLTPDGKAMLVVKRPNMNYAEKQIMYYDAWTGRATGKVIRSTVSIPVLDISGLDISGNGKMLVITAWNCASLWSLSDARPLGSEVCLDGYLTHARFHPDNHRVALWNRETARLWDPQSPTPLGRPMKNPFDIADVGFATDGSRMFIRGSGKLRVWKVPTEEATGMALEDGADVDNAAFSPDGRVVMASAGDNMAQNVSFWDARTGEALGKLPGNRHVAGAAFISGGKRLILGGEGVEIWSLDGLLREPSPEELMDRARRKSLRELDSRGEAVFLSWEALRNIATQRRADTGVSLTVDGTVIPDSLLKAALPGAFTAGKKSDGSPMANDSHSAIRNNSLEDAIKWEIIRRRLDETGFKRPADEQIRILKGERVESNLKPPSSGDSAEAIRDWQTFLAFGLLWNSNVRSLRGQPDIERYLEKEPRLHGFFAKVVDPEAKKAAARDLARLKSWLISAPPSAVSNDPDAEELAELAERLKKIGQGAALVVKFERWIVEKLLDRERARYLDDLRQQAVVRGDFLLNPEWGLEVLNFSQDKSKD